GWIAEGRPRAGGTVNRTIRDFRAKVRPEFVVTADAVSSRIGKAGWLLLDARPPERYRGEIEPLDRAAGHIPGAVNRFYERNVDERGTFRPADDLRAELGALVGGRALDRVICYCGSGVTACQNLLALEHAG